MRKSYVPNYTQQVTQVKSHMLSLRCQITHSRSHMSNHTCQITGLLSFISHFQMSCIKFSHLSVICIIMPVNSYCQPTFLTFVKWKDMIYSGFAYTLLDKTYQGHVTQNLFFISPIIQSQGKMITI